MKRLHTIALAAALLAQAATAQTLPPPPVSPTPITRYEYDAQGNRTKIIRGAGTLNLETKLSYDPLYRVKDHTDPKNGKTSFEYDGGDRTTKVTDPRSLVTQYPRDGFGNATQLISPDTGTANQTYNEIGNITTRTDSRGVLESYTYDAMDRLTQLVYSQSGQPSQTVSWAYDLKGPDYSYSANRLSRTDHPNGWSRFKYDQRGRVLEAVQSVSPAAGANGTAIVSITRYGYTLGRLTSITYPSGRKVVQSYTSRNVTGIGLAQDVNGTPVPLLSDIKWEPFGPVTSWNWNMAGGTTPHERFYDLSGRVTRYRLGNVFRDVTYDAADRIISFTHLSANDGIPQPALDQNFGYDENDRITQVTTVASSWSITYDPNGNRTGMSLNGSPSIYNVEATSNRLASITNPARSFGYDNAGNTITDSPNYTATYGLSGSLASVTRAGLTGTYTYDADKRRIRKVTSAGASSTIIFVYGLNGELLGEYDQNGAAIREYIWLDDIPVAMFTPDPANPRGAPLVFYIHADHLNAPRLVVDMNDVTRWRWFAEPFGTTAPEANPSGLGSFTQNLRFPGQYADAESGLWYNYFRSYDSTIGRYSSSDPIGLMGGVNTYAYVEANPVSLVDPSGLLFFNLCTGCHNGVNKGPLPVTNGPTPTKDPIVTPNTTPPNKQKPTPIAPPLPLSDRQCVVYNLEDCQNEVIYVGITSRDPYFREREHENAPDGKMNIYKCEMCDLHFLVIATYNNRRDCEYAETQQIQALRPFANIKKNPDTGDVRWKKYTEWWSKRCIPCQ